MPYGPVPYDIGPGTSFAYGVSQPVLPPWAAELDLTTVVSGIFRLWPDQLSQVSTWTAYIGSPPAYTAQSTTFVAMVYDFVGGEFGGRTGNWWVAPLLTLTNGKTVECTPDYLTVTNPAGRR